MVHCVGPAKGVGGPHEVGPRRARSSEKGIWFGSEAVDGFGSRASLPCLVRGAFERGGSDPPFPVRFEGPLRGVVHNPYSGSRGL